MNFIAFLCFFIASVTAFSVTKSKLSSSVVLNAIPDNTFVIAELYSSPAATYNGELISESLKAVPAKYAKPDGKFDYMLKDNINLSTKPSKNNRL